MEEKGYREMDLSRATGIPQSTLSRSLRTARRVTKTHHAICKFLAIDLTQMSESKNLQERLVKALLGTWDGSDTHAKALIDLLRAASAISEVGLRGARKIG